MARSSEITLWEIADSANLQRAAHLAARGVRNRPVVAQFMVNLAWELRQMQRAILDETVEVGQTTAFTIHDPKPRQIFAPVFPERVLQHAVMACVGPALDKALVADTFACRIGKGTIAAVQRAQHHSRRFTWYGQIDIRRYFPSVNHDVLLTALDRRFRDAGVRRLLWRIVTAHEEQPGRGLPIGALCSQHFANFYLAPLDRAILEHSPARAMVRYMDDVVIWAHSSQDVRQTLQIIRQVVADRLRLELRDEPVINRVDHGISFCGFRIHPGIIRASSRRKRRFVAARSRWETRFVEGMISSTELQRGYDAAFGIMAHADSKAWRKRQLQISPPPWECDEA